MFDIYVTDKDGERLVKRELSRSAAVHHCERMAYTWEHELPRTDMYTFTVYDERNQLVWFDVYNDKENGGVATW